MSTTVFIDKFPMHEWMIVGDIEKNEFNFTDGIGQASNEVCMMIDDIF